jgi:hypothetical protein
MPEKTKLFISTPCYDAMMTMQYTLSLLNLMPLLNRYKVECVVDFTGNESLIPRARNNALGKFMKSDCSHILFIDADIEFPPQAVIDLILFDKDVSCCAYPKKSYNWKRFLHSMQHDDESKESLDSRGLDYAFNIEYGDNNELIKEKDFIRVKHASNGFMLVKRSLVEKLQKKHTELEIITDNLSQTDDSICGLFCCMIKDKQYLSEDYSFCQRVRDIDGEVWMSVKHNLNHIGKHVFRGDIQHRHDYGRSADERALY